MSLEENKAIVRRFIEAENKRNLDSMDEFIAPDFVSIESDTPTRGLEIYKQGIKTFTKAFPDLRGTIEDIIAEGDKVMARVKYTGTNTGEYLGLAPTGKKISMKAVAIYRIVDTKVVEMRSFIDRDFFIELGVIEYTEKAKKLFPED